MNGPLILAVTPEQFGVDAKAWIEVGSALLYLLIEKVGILIIAAFGLIKTFRTQDVELRQDLQAVKERQDRQGDRLDQVALAVPPVGAPANGNGTHRTNATNGEPAE